MKLTKIIIIFMATLVLGACSNAEETVSSSQVEKETAETEVAETVIAETEPDLAFSTDTKQYTFRGISFQLPDYYNIDSSFDRNSLMVGSEDSFLYVMCINGNLTESEIAEWFDNTATEYVLVDTYINDVQDYTLATKEYKGNFSLLPDGAALFDVSYIYNPIVDKTYLFEIAAYDASNYIFDDYRQTMNSVTFTDDIINDCIAPEELQTVECNGLSIMIPDYYKFASDDDSTVTYTYENVSAFAFGNIGATYSNASDEKINEITDGIAYDYLSDYVRISSSHENIAGFDILFNSYMGHIDDYQYDMFVLYFKAMEYDCFISFINNHYLLYRNDDFYAALETLTFETTEEPEIQNDTDASIDGVSPDLRAFLDSYESFMDEYVEFMQGVKNGTSTLEMLSQYSDIMSRYAEFTDAANAYDTSDMSSEDSKYYLEVMLRVQQKLLSVL